MDADQVLAFRLARSGPAARAPGGPAAAAALPFSDVARDAALIALAARSEDVTRAGYEAAVEDGALVLAHAPRGAVHAMRPGGDAVFGRALIARDDDELGAQLRRQAQRLSAMRRRVRPALMPWCPACGTHHVAPMPWRYATVAAAARLDAARRDRLGPPGRHPPALAALRAFLGWYGPASRGRLVAAWRMRLQGGRATVTVERLGPGRLPVRAVEAQARRVAAVRGAARAAADVS